MKTTNQNPEKKNLHFEYFLFIYTICVSLFAITLFLYAFFPINYYENVEATMEEVPKFIKHTRLKVAEQYAPAFEKVVIMVIDALRWDFLVGDNNNGMPNVNNILKSNGCLLKTKVTPPTVTMPRIKAMMTGTIPNFADIALNFGAKSISTDSLLKQAKNHGHKLVFYGDETWLKLFPDIFHRQEGTTSFFVTDFTEVDNNVTRHIPVELQKDDWSIMILHYLGLDHIGHVSGPFSPLIKPKLIEMDEIISQIHTRLTHWNNNNVRTLFLVCGDHGMKDSGGHGGATLEETVVPLIAFGTSCNHGQEMSQTDVAVTLSVLMGLPIPHGNLGRVSLDLMHNVPTVRKLFALHYNCKQLLIHYRQLQGYENRKAYKSYLQAVKLHSIWLNTNNFQESLVDDIIAEYNSALSGMKNVLVNNPIKYDVLLMVIAIIFMCQVLYINIKEPNFEVTPLSKKVLKIFVMSTTAWIFLNYILRVNEETNIFSGGLNSFLLIILPSACIIVSNSFLCAKCSTTKTELNKYRLLLHIGAIVHAVSLGSSSFVEEEHQTWYFYWVTILLFFVFDTINFKSVKKFEHKLFFSLVVVLICHRLLRTLNSTGDKWAHLPDVSNWLYSEESKLGMSFLLLFGLVLLVWLDYLKKSSTISIAIDAFLAVLIYLRHAASKSVIGAAFLPHSRGVLEIRFYWLIVLADILIGIRRLKSVDKNFGSELLFLLLRWWIFVTAVLHQPSNLILLPVHLMVGAVIHRLCQKYKDRNICTMLYILSGNVFYFYQGNSNSLATIDVAAGYVGLESYQPIVTGIFLFVNTYTSPVLALLMCLYDGELRNPTRSRLEKLTICKEYITWRLVPMTVYAVIVTIQRYHLFVWSVFSPKLLYEAAHCGILFVVMFVVEVIFLIHDSCKCNYE